MRRVLSLAGERVTRGHKFIARVFLCTSFFSFKNGSCELSLFPWGCLFMKLRMRCSLSLSVDRVTRGHKFIGRVSLCTVISLGLFFHEGTDALFVESFG